MDLHFFSSQERKENGQKNDNGDNDGDSDGDVGDGVWSEDNGRMQENMPVRHMFISAKRYIIHVLRIVSITVSMILITNLFLHID